MCVITTGRAGRLFNGAANDKLRNGKRLDGTERSFAAERIRRSASDETSVGIRIKRNELHVRGTRVSLSFLKIIMYTTPCNYYARRCQALFRLVPSSSLAPAPFRCPRKAPAAAVPVVAELRRTFAWTSCSDMGTNSRASLP